MFFLLNFNKQCFLLTDIDKKRAVQLQASHLAYLEQHPYEEFTAEELSAAKRELQREMEAVKAGMGHGDLSLDAYTQVWEECLAQVRENEAPF